jgi:hypothetical protein
VLIIPLQTLLATSVFHVQTHREPRALTGLLHPELSCKSRVREESKWNLVRRWIYRFVVILIKTNGETNTFPICLFVLSEQLVPSLSVTIFTPGFRLFLFRCK